MQATLAAGLGSAFAGPCPAAPPPEPTSSPLPAPQRIAERAGLAHDAGNLLGALGLYCDLLQAPGVLRSEHKHYAAELRSLADRSGSMIRRLLAEHLPQPAAPSRHDATCADPARVLLDQAPLLERIAAPSATVTVEVAPGLPPLAFPGEVLERIATNLVRNAAEAIQKASENDPSSRPRAGSAPSAPVAPGKICVSLTHLAGQLHLLVEDDGPGLPPAIAAAFLRPAPLPPGVQRGLGHRIVHELAQTTGGQLFIRVRPGRGTAFTLTWPTTPVPNSKESAAC